MMPGDGPRVACHDDLAAPPRSFHDLLGMDLAALCVDDRLPALQEPEIGARLDAQFHCSLGMEHPRPRLLLEAPGQPRQTVVGRGGLQPVVLGLEDGALSDLLDQERELRPADEPLRVAHELVEAARAEQHERLLPAEQAVGLQKAGQPKIVVAVQMRQENHADARQSDRTHQLPLRALPAVDEHALAPADDQCAGGTPVNGRSGTGGAEKDELQVQTAALVRSAKRSGRRAAPR